MVPLQSNSGVPQATTAFFVALASTTEGNGQAVAPIGGTFKNLFIQLASPLGGAAQTMAFTLRVNGVDTGVTCTINSGGTTASDTTHSATIAAGQTWSIKVVTSATTGTTPFIAGGIEFDNP